MGDSPYNILKLLAALGVFVFALSTPFSQYGTSPFQTAAPTSPLEYGEKLGQTIDDVVNSIYASVQGSLITHADVLAILCMEQGGANRNLQTRITSTAGAKGLTQVMPGTFGDYARENRGGFNQIGCSYSQIQTNPRCAIEAGSRIFNDLLMRYDGDRTTAARAYNGGPGRAYGSLPSETYTYAYVKLPQCMNSILAAQAPVRSTVWQTMIQKVSSLTNGTFRLMGSGKPVPFSDSGWADVAANPRERLGEITSGWFDNNSGGQNPIASLLGIRTGGRTTGVSQTRTNYSTPEPNPSSPGILDSGEKQVPDIAPAGQESDTLVVRPTARTSPLGETPDDETESIKGADPTLFCLPSPVSAGEEALILWACRDTAYKTAGDNFETNGALIGTTRVTPTSDTTYTLECINDAPKVQNTVGSCTIEVANPQLALISTPRQTTRGGSVSISWQTTDTTSCILTSDADPNFSRNGTRGDSISPPLSKNTTFTLTCETATGAIKEQSIETEVR